jgi:hypothetical protein
MLLHERFSDDVQLEEFEAFRAIANGDVVSCVNCQADRECGSFRSCPHCHSPLCDDICLSFHLEQFRDCKHGLEVD